MILPIVGYGSAILRKKCVDIDKDYEGLDELLENMWETLYNSNGVGLAAPQINRAIRVFIVDSEQIFNEDEDELEDEDDYDEEMNFPDSPGYRGVFINARLLRTGGKPWKYNEGCLSIPKIREDIQRDEEIEIEYYDENWEKHTRVFNGLTARIILHEYDHIEGKLFIDYVSPIKKALFKRRLEDITKGKVSMGYRMVWPK